MTPSGSSSPPFYGDKLPNMQRGIGDKGGLLLCCRSGKPSSFLNQRGEIMSCFVKVSWRFQSYIEVCVLF